MYLSFLPQNIVPLEEKSLQGLPLTNTPANPTMMARAEGGHCFFHGPERKRRKKKCEKCSLISLHDMFSCYIYIYIYIYDYIIFIFSFTFIFIFIFILVYSIFIFMIIGKQTSSYSCGLCHRLMPDSHKINGSHSGCFHKELHSFLW